NAINIKNKTNRSTEINRHLETLNAFDPKEKLSLKASEDLFKKHSFETKHKDTINKNTTGRGITWFNSLTNDAESISDISTVRVANSDNLGEKSLIIAVVPDNKNPFPRVRKGEMGLREGWTVAKHIMEVIES